MTQPAVSGDFQTSVTQPAPAVAPAPPAPVSLTDRVLIASELGATVEEARKIVSNLRSLAKYLFADGAVWEVGASLPGSNGLAVFAAFNVDLLSNDMDGLDRVPGDARFYVIPEAGITDPLAPDLLCYTVNRGSPVTSVERLTLGAFVREVGREWYNLAVVQGIVEEPDEEDDEDDDE